MSEFSCWIHSTRTQRPWGTSCQSCHRAQRPQVNLTLALTSRNKVRWQESLRICQGCETVVQACPIPDTNTSPQEIRIIDSKSWPSVEPSNRLFSVPCWLVCNTTGSLPLLSLHTSTIFFQLLKVGKNIDNIITKYSETICYLSNSTSFFQWHILLFPLLSSSLTFFMALVKWACSFSRFSSLLPPALSLSVSLFLPHAPPALLLGNPLYDLLLLTSCHMTSGWLLGKLWEVWLLTFLNPSPDTNQGIKQI